MTPNSSAYDEFTCDNPSPIKYTLVVLHRAYLPRQRVDITSNVRNFRDTNDTKNPTRTMY